MDVTNLCPLCNQNHFFEEFPSFTIPTLNNISFHEIVNRKSPHLELVTVDGKNVIIKSIISSKGYCSLVFEGEMEGKVVVLHYIKLELP